MWILLHEWTIPLWKYPVLPVDFRLCVPAAVKARVVQELSAVQAFRPGQFQGRSPLHDGAVNNNSLLRCRDGHIR